MKELYCWIKFWGSKNLLAQQILGLEFIVYSTFLNKKIKDQKTFQG